ncbi:MAG: acyltransferase [Burkholderiaceae bacterium]
MYSAIEGIRALGALSVATSHAWSTMIRELPWFHGGFLVVEMFFVLSGYLLARHISARIQGPADAAAEIIRRFGRLYPLHLTVMFAWLAIFYGKQLVSQGLLAIGIDVGATPVALQAPFDPGYFALNLLMLHGVGIQDSDLFNFPAWSISVEFWSFAVLVSIKSVFRQARERRIIFAVLLALCIAHYYSIWLHEGDPVPKQPIALKVLTRGLLAYLCGALAAELQQTINWRPRPSTIGIWQAVLVSAIVWAVSHQTLLPMSQAYIPVLWAAVLISLSSAHGPLAWCLSRPWIAWIGKRSFAIYISHALLLLLFSRRMGMVSDPWLLLLGWAAYMGAAIALGDFLHRRIELPAFEPFRRMAARVRLAAGRHRDHGTGGAAGASVPGAGSAGPIAGPIAGPMPGHAALARPPTPE